MYAKARAGEITHFTGIDDPYEAPSRRTCGCAPRTATPPTRPPARPGPRRADARLSWARPTRGWPPGWPSRPARCCSSSATAAGSTGKELGKRGDQESNELLLAELAAARPDDAVLSEESADSPARLDADRVWIIDPLDGTREYGMPGRPDWAVHVALWQRGGADGHGSITDAAVAQPVADGGLCQRHRPPATPRRSTSAGTGLRFLVSDSRPPAWAAPGRGALGAELAPMGSAGAKAMAVLRGEADAYLHAGGQWEWDSAAPVGVVLAAGLHASRIDGSPAALQPAAPLPVRTWSSAGPTWPSRCCVPSPRTGAESALR